jgi:dTDP-4-dehydrorhamnose 3,5-epimerase-like enzyme
MRKYGKHPNGLYTGVFQLYQEKYTAFTFKTFIRYLFLHLPNQVQLIITRRYWPMPFTQGMRSVQVINGVRLLRHKAFADSRGALVAFEQNRNLPFKVERVFTIEVEEAGVSRGGHANSCDELIVCLSGSVIVDVDNGDERKSIRLGTKSESVWIGAGILINLRHFDPRTVLLVFASALYEDTLHYDQPQPQLIYSDCVA